MYSTFNSNAELNIEMCVCAFLFVSESVCVDFLLLPQHFRCVESMTCSLQPFTFTFGAHGRSGLRINGALCL